MAANANLQSTNISKSLVLCLFCWINCIFHCCCSSTETENDQTITFEVLYQAGKDAYKENRWAECSAYMLKSLEDYRFYTRNLAQCRITCKKRSYSETDHRPGNRGDDVNFIFFSRAIRNSDCVRRCKKKVFGERPEYVNPDTSNEFEKNEPYDYLQLCLYQTGNMKEASAAAYTYYLLNPDSDLMLRNIHRYRKMEGVTDEDFVNLSEYPHIKLYLKGIKSYGSQEWLDVIQAMEAGLHSYFEEHEICEALCEGSSDHKGVPDFYNAIADHYINVLKCKKQCVPKLSRVFAKVIDNIVAEFYHYLQFAYFQAADIKSASRCVGSYLLFKPNDATMMTNRKLYLHFGISEESMKPRDDATRFHYRTNRESELLNLIESGKYFSGKVDPSDDKDVQSDSDFQPLTADNKVMDLQNLFLSHPNGNGDAFADYITKRGVKFTEQSDDNLRLFGEGALTKENCNDLIYSAMIAGIQKEGDREVARNQPYPESWPREGIHFLRSERLAEVVQVKKLKTKVLELFLNTVEFLKEVAVNYFNVTEELYVRDVRMLCRKIYNEQIDDPVKLEDMCILQEDGLCLSDHAWDGVDYHAVMYMNDNHFGGTTDFMYPGVLGKTVVNPSCGKFFVVSPKKNVHNVHPIMHGSRCALSIAFSLEKSSQDFDYIKTHAVLKEIAFLEKEPKNTLYSDGMMEFYQSKGIKVSLKPDDLNGTQRFAADGLASEEQCKKLITLAQTHSTGGDGYHAELDDVVKMTGVKESPHTVHEKFQGLTVDFAIKLAESKKVQPDSVRLFLHLSELAKEVIQSYLQLDTPLYFDFTHLVCRTAVNDENKNRTDLSHPVHADNCLLQKDGSCVKELPAYVQRDYSAILYLNDDFEGGEFMFTDKKLKVESIVKPKCGRVVGFNAADFHGVKAVLKGQRCAIAMWYTLDPFYSEVAHVRAKKVLDKMATTEGEDMGDSIKDHHGGEL